MRNEELPVIEAAKEGNIKKIEEILQSSQLRPEKPVTAVDEQGNTALFWAVRIGSISVMLLLLNAKADIHHANRSWMTALHWAARFDKAEAAQLLIERKAKVDATPLDYKSTSSVSQRITPLFVAAARENQETGQSTPAFEVMKVLITAKANPNIHPADHVMPLHFIAAISRDDRLLAALLALGARVPLKNPKEMMSTRQFLYSAAKKNMTIFEYARTIHQNLPCISPPLARLVAEYTITETEPDTLYRDGSSL